jgi:L-lactate utilization protein LutB
VFLAAAVSISGANSGVAVPVADAGSVVVAEWEGNGPMFLTSASP